jgi:hypothetical protein
MLDLVRELGPFWITVIVAVFLGVASGIWKIGSAIVKRRSNTPKLKVTTEERSIQYGPTGSRPQLLPGTSFGDDPVLLIRLVNPPRRNLSVTPLDLQLHMASSLLMFLPKIPDLLIKLHLYVGRHHVLHLGDQPGTIILSSTEIQPGGSSEIWPSLSDLSWLIQEQGYDGLVFVRITVVDKLRKRHRSKPVRVR